MVNKGMDKCRDNEAGVLIENGTGVLYTVKFIRSPQLKRIRISKKALVHKDALSYPEYPHP